ncbi:hypothetical protein BC833DRAFT_574629 [Globomyces pollinis-pini]|nr:hypothetical protein BC833DRAFT_574629 [Globomyces pollinis-pini]
MKSFSNVVSKAMSKIFLQKALISNELQEPLDLIIDRLYLGQLSQATDPNILKEYGITHIINACQTENIFEFGIDEALKNIKTDGYETKVNDWKFEFQTPIYCRISISDHVDSKMTKYFEKIFDFIEMALMNPNSKILIHCKGKRIYKGNRKVNEFMKVIVKLEFQGHPLWLFLI